MITGLDEAIDALARLRVGHDRLPGEVRLETAGEVAELLIDNPGARGALTLGMMKDLAVAVATLERWPGAAVLVRSTPGAFCAGGHLGEVRARLTGPEEGRAMALAMGVVLDALLGLPQVVVAAIDGPAVGGGAELATAVDHRVLSPRAWIEFRQAALGVGAGWGGIRRLVQHVAPPIALRWVTTARRVEPEAGLAVGFVDVVDDDPIAGARRLLEPVLALPPSGVRACKRQLALARRPLGDREADVDAFTQVWGGPAHRAALGR
jgi:ethylmalonyl-CoA/methylmalonyl-CoA decarboxylase